ncbi:hypothetical protein FHS57_000782 [Runella defluvii]|uniref:Peptidase M48 domain-containing protein n=1 Tax=Runella defluvii TaxID=370973 RepID=A0A7W5ZHP1_9BACT|nr:hypothetical protein [Runella defluvii]MBB3836800.1 hypothetical protein [Runella defluvii]
MRIISENNNERIQNSFDRICENCNNGLSETLKNSQLIISDNLSAESIYSNKDENLKTIFKKAYSEGFGGILANVEYENVKSHLVVLNITKIDEFELTDSELDGVFSHELGHIFNENPKREEPSILKGNTQIEIDNAKKIERKEAETYADYFSKRTNCSQGLIGSINKYILSDNCKNKELFQERLEQLKKEEVLHGTIKPIR